MIYVDKWPGLVTNASPYAIPPGAAVTQVNLQVLSPGQLSVRPGNVAVVFQTHTGGTSSVLRMFRYPVAGENLVYQTASGGIFVARGPQ